MLSFFRHAVKKRVLSKKLKGLGRVGVNVTIDRSLAYQYPENIYLGRNVYLGPNCFIHAMGGVEVGDGVIIGPNVSIHSANHRYDGAESLPYDKEHVLRKVHIGENVWVGANVIIVPGAIIGEGAVIGAGCVVSGVIKPLSVVIGNPCRVIKQRNSEHYYDLKKRGSIYMEQKLKEGR